MVDFGPTTAASWVLFFIQHHRSLRVVLLPLEPCLVLLKGHYRTLVWYNMGNAAGASRPQSRTFEQNTSRKDARRTAWTASRAG